MLLLPQAMPAQQLNDSLHLMAEKELRIRLEPPKESLLPTANCSLLTTHYSLLTVITHYSYSLLAARC